MIEKEELLKHLLHAQVYLYVVSLRKDSSNYRL